MIDGVINGLIQEASYPDCSYWQLYICRNCGQFSIRHLVEGGHKGWVMGCQCWLGLDLLGWLPIGVIPVVDEKDELEGWQSGNAAVC